MVGEPLRLHKAMQPETFPARSVTTDRGRGFAQTQARFGLGHFVEQAFEVTCRHGTFARLLTMVGIMLGGSLWSSWAVSSLVIG